MIGFQEQRKILLIKKKKFGSNSSLNAPDAWLFLSLQFVLKRF